MLSCFKRMGQEIEYWIQLNLFLSVWNKGDHFSLGAILIIVDDVSIILIFFSLRVWLYGHNLCTFSNAKVQGPSPSYPNHSPWEDQEGVGNSTLACFLGDSYIHVTLKTHVICYTLIHVICYTLIIIMTNIYETLGGLKWYGRYYIWNIDYPFLAK